ncbi:DUF938 domain-containing protein [Rhodobacter ferrooxidans]|uniref:DUF938 domain-containing protein n=1 Tax=Rhodobacter ferrooxidans TaxID=371731 RepID=C8S2G6_9RHOB|nr:DUF938 domain-containing protein [Rhodobacter sp. SW2]EEW24837.1 protein of unknown function DUF938 [Rhodobacter sp. SW2]
MKLPDSGAPVTPDGRRHAPSAARNAGPILQLLQAELPAQGQVLELAAGTGQHAAEFAAALPGLVWQPTDADPDNMVSIRAWADFSGCDTLRPPLVLDAARPGWAQAWPGQDAVLVVNLLHLIPVPAAKVVLCEGIAALAPVGKLLIYGPFLRDGRTTSDGDAAFHASLQAQDPGIGYKDLGWVAAQVHALGAQMRVQPMPANNLALVIFK